MSVYIILLYFVQCTINDLDFLFRLLANSLRWPIGLVPRPSGGHDLSLASPVFYLIVLARVDRDRAASLLEASWPDSACVLCCESRSAHQPYHGEIPLSTYR